MTEHDDVDAAFFQRRDLSQRRRSAIDRDQKLRSMLLAAPFHAFRTQPVTFLHPERQKQSRGRFVGAQRFSQQRQRRHTVDVVIAKQNDPFPPIQRTEDPSDGTFHVWQEKRIAQRLETRPQESLHLIGAGKAFAQKQTGDAGRSANFAPGNRSVI